MLANKRVEINRKKKSDSTFKKVSNVCPFNFNIRRRRSKMYKKLGGVHQPDVKRGIKKENLEGQLFCSPEHHRRSEIEKNPLRPVQIANALKNGKKFSGV